MDGHAGNFEDQFRRMVVSSGASTNGGNDGVPPNHPTVRLPPANSYSTPQQPSPGFPAQQNGYAQPAPSRFGQQPHGQPPHGRSGPHAFQQRHQPQAPQGSRYAQPQGFYQNRGGFYGPPPQRMNNAPQGQRARNQQQVALDSNAFQRGGYAPPRGRGGGQHQLFNPHQQRAQPMLSFGDQYQRKINYLQAMATSEVGSVQMTQTERDEKNAFRQALQQVCNDVCDADPDRLPHVSLECFGSFKSGFATAGSDMDLVIVVKDPSSTSASLSLMEDDLPRALERQLLKLGYGARLLTRTRVPIIKVCEKPDTSLLSKLRAEREKWDLLPNELKYPHLHQDDEGEAEEGAGEGVNEKVPQVPNGTDGDHPVDSTVSSPPPKAVQLPQQNGKADVTVSETSNIDAEAKVTEQPKVAPNGETAKTDNPRPRRDDRPWIRERKAGPLDFPKSGVGIQSDINFFNPLGLHNTQLLYCYALCDDRVQPMVLFVKAWAKRRKINSSYSGTLSSYGFVLMVLHYLVNVASPPVIPNLQSQQPPPGQTSPQDAGVEVDGWNVRFWRNDDEITSAKQKGHITVNREPLGSLLAGFFQYFSSQGGGAQFVWTQQVLSLRSHGGILTKEEKGWTKAVTEEGEGKKIQHRYLFCIEDPFELNHNVARTVTHNGIVAIRDEFRRARRILMVVGRGDVPVVDGQLFDQLVEPEEVISIAHETPKDGWKPDVDGLTDKIATTTLTPHHQPARINTRNPQPPRKTPQTPTPPKANAFNVKDNDAFPTLGAASSNKSSSKGRSPHKRTPSTGEWSEISGDKAKAVLDEVKRKKDEAQAESTAMGAAEAVLGDDW